MNSLILLTEIYNKVEDLDPTNQDWDLDDYNIALTACEVSPMKSYIYLKDLETGESILIEAFE